MAAEADEDNSGYSGTAYLFDFDETTWMQSAKLTASEGASDDQSGYSVSLDGSRALVGTIGDDDNGNDSSAAYVFEIDGTTCKETATLTVTDVTPVISSASQLASTAAKRWWARLSMTTTAAIPVRRISSD